MLNVTITLLRRFYLFPSAHLFRFVPLMEPQGQSPWYLHENILLRQGSRLPKNLFGEQVGGLSASSEIRRSSTAHRHRMIRPRLTHSSTGKARGLLRRRIESLRVLILQQILNTRFCPHRQSRCNPQGYLCGS
jgi:hypothetical protein